VENNIVVEHIEQLESSFIIKTEEIQGLDQVRSVLRDARQALEKYIEDSPTFASSLQPIVVGPSVPPVVQRMAFAASLTDVGPMASVAGVLVDIIFEKIWELGSRHILVENGGEIMAHSDSARSAFKVGIYAGPGSSLNHVAFILPQGRKIGIGTSSANVGHATSFGEADLVTVFSKSSGIADAAATAICNAIVGDDVPRSIELGIQFAAKYSNIVDGVFIVRSEKVGTWGTVPDMVLVENRPK
jgi:ApbE superfamily uncharacterized protein (UPF0280 family)